MVKGIIGGGTNALAWANRDYHPYGVSNSGQASPMPIPGLITSVDFTANAAAVATKTPSMTLYCAPAGSWTFVATNVTYTFTDAFTPGATVNVPCHLPFNKGDKFIWRMVSDTEAVAANVGWSIYYTAEAFIHLGSSAAVVGLGTFSLVGQATNYGPTDGLQAKNIFPCDGVITDLAVAVDVALTSINYRFFAPTGSLQGSKNRLKAGELHTSFNNIIMVVAEGDKYNMVTTVSPGVENQKVSWGFCWRPKIVGQNILTASQFISTGLSASNYDCYMGQVALGNDYRGRVPIKEGLLHTLYAELNSPAGALSTHGWDISSSLGAITVQFRATAVSGNNKINRYKCVAGNKGTFNFVKLAVANAQTSHREAIIHQTEVAN
jgi:hypothetical protein